MKALQNSAQMNSAAAGFDGIQNKVDALSRFRVSKMGYILENAAMVFAFLIFVWVSAQNIALG